MDLYRITRGKRGFLGSTEVDVNNYWTGGKNSQQLRCNETVLYAEIDCCQELAAIAKTKEQLQEQYGRMDMFYLCLQAVKFYHADAALLRCAGVVIGNMVNEGCFSGDFESIEAENLFVDELVVELQDRTESFAEVAENDNFMNWYKDNVLDLNYYHNYDGSKTDTPRLNGLGAAMSSDEYSKMAKEGGMYLLYLVTDTDGKDGKPEQISKKKLKQNKFLQYMHSSGTNVTRQSILANAKSGIIAKSGSEPAETLDRFKEEARADQEGVKGVGWLITLISMIVTAVVIIVNMVVSAVQARKAAEAQQYIDTLNMQAPTPEELQGASPEYADYQKEIESTINRIADTNASIANTWLWSGIGVLAAGFAGLTLVKMKIRNKFNKN